MTGRGRAMLVIALGALYSGLSLGGRMFYLAAVFALLSILLSLLAVLLFRYGTTITCQTSAGRIPRCSSVGLHIQVSSRLPLPVSPLRLTVLAGEHRETHPLLLNRGKGSLDLEIPAWHVGEWQIGVERAAFSDVLGLFNGTIRRQNPASPLLVLPRSFKAEPMRFLPGDEGRAIRSRVNEDLTSPEDTRSYRAGDPLNHIHWKLTARRRELIVRRFETPAPPDTLILMDCTPPTAGNTAEAVASLRDTLCETALSAAECQAGDGMPVRVPFYGSKTDEYLSDRSGNSDRLAELLARQAFDGEIPFSRVLNLELRRMRRTGATAIITTRLDADVVEGVKHIRRMGPSARVYYVTYTPDAPEDQPYIAQLQQSLVEVCYVTPA